MTRDKKDKNKETSSETLNVFVGEDEDVKTEVAKDAENFAYRKLGRYAGRKLLDAIQRAKKKPKKKD